MGQKVNPVGLRLGINRTWDSRWYADDDYAQLLHEDLQIRKFLFDRLNQAGIGRIVIERPAKKARITIHTARPGVVIGKKGADIERLRTDITKMTGSDVHLNIVEIRKPEIEAKLVAEEHRPAACAARRVPPGHEAGGAVRDQARRAGHPQSTAADASAGAEIARTEWYREGRVPLHTLRADVDFGLATARTAYGTCGVKVWVFKGEIMAHDPMAQDKRAMEQATPR